MSNRFRPTTGGAQHATAVEVFASDGGRLPVAANQSFPAMTDADRAMMAAYGIRFDGGGFCFAGYRYNRLADAFNDARRANTDGSP